MRVAVLRASGRALEPNAFLAEHSISADAIWQAGESDHRGRQREESGFNVCVSEQDDKAAFLHEIERFLVGNQAMLSDLLAHGANAELDLGLTVGSESQFTASVSIPPHLLVRLGEAQVTLTISAYPSSD